MTGVEAASLVGALSGAPEVFALLDDSRAGPGRSSRLYTGFSHEHRCTDPATLDARWAAVAADQARGLHAVLLADYEWGAKLLGAGLRGGPQEAGASLRVLMFRSLQLLAPAEVAAWLQAQDEGAAQPTPAGPLDLQASVGEGEFHAAIAAIHEAIRHGETYQVNHTYRLSGRAHGTPAGLFRRLRARQPVAYGAFIALPPSADADAPTHVLSLSPELFLKHEAGRVTARPMKGTASRLRCPESDSEAARALQQDVKNRAENLMIVDLLRNDLGRIAQIGSVKVPALFAVEPYTTVFQMTSTVQAQLRPGIDMPALLRATFPCGSITGAPKHHTMDLISRFEVTPRGLYCGAIGWVDAPQPGAAYSSLGDFCLSVAIRTLTLGAVDAATGTRALRLGVGAGIVQDSVAADEFEECRLKARFLTGLDPGCQLFETMRAERDAQGLAVLPRRAAHLARVAASARALGWAADVTVAGRLLDERLAALAGEGPWRLRLALRADGEWALTDALLPPLPAPKGPVGLLLAAEPLPPQPLGGHKSTLRAAYDAGIRQAEGVGAFDTLFCSADGRLVEGGRSTLYLKLDGQWCTPPLADGALPGVVRAAALAGQEPFFDGPVQARSLRREHLLQAERLALSNALRGVLPAVLWSLPAAG